MYNYNVCLSILMNAKTKATTQRFSELKFSPLEMPFPLISFLAEVKIFNFWPKTILMFDDLYRSKE